MEKIPENDFDFGPDYQDTILLRQLHPKATSIPIDTYWKPALGFEMILESWDGIFVEVKLDVK